MVAAVVVEVIVIPHLQVEMVVVDGVILETLLVLVHQYHKKVVITLAAVVVVLEAQMVAFQETVEKVVMDCVSLDILKTQQKQLVDLFHLLGQKQFMLSQEIVE